MIKMMSLKCTCGNNINADGNDQSILMQESKDHLQEHSLDASFVHLPAPTNQDSNAAGNTSEDFDLFNQGILHTYRHINVLLQVAEGHLDLSDGNGMDEHICLSCVERVASAIDENIDHLRDESRAYEEAVDKEKDKQRRLRKALLINAGIAQEQEKQIDSSHHSEEIITSATSHESEISHEHGGGDILQRTVNTLQQEIQHLQSACREHEVELWQLNSLLKEQAHLSHSLTQEENDLMMEFNAVEIDAKVFQETHQQLTHQCHAAERERYYLSKVHLHSALFKIDIYGHGLDYPVINNLRLSHRPKGTLTWPEVNAAWSYCAQLVIYVGSTIKFKSKDLRVVPLTTCAKIIEVGIRGDRKIVHNLGVDFGAMDRKTHRTEHIIPSIKSFHALLYQMVAHIQALGRMKNLDKLPFHMEPFVIGTLSLVRIHEQDDLAWSDVVRCITSNLKWLSENASKCAFRV